MSISIRTDHLLLDEQGPTITAFGYNISWLIQSVSIYSGGEHQGYEFYRELMIERLDTKGAERPGRTWHWTKKHGRWTTMRGGGEVDGWVAG
jgi:hypothetical protein